MVNPAQHAPAQRRAFADALRAVAPDAPTLCEGWTAYDLAAHVWLRERRPMAAAGAVIDRLADRTAAAMAEVKRNTSYEALADELAVTPRSPLTLVPALDDLVNTLEFFIHTEDVLRANALPPRARDAALEDWVWRRLPTMARLFLRGVGCGLVLERETGASHRIRPGATTVQVVGLPTELALVVYGRAAHADVRFFGTDADVAAVRGHVGP